MLHRSERGQTCGTMSFDALWQALAPFDGLIGDLLASVPSEAADG